MRRGPPQLEDGRDDQSTYFIRVNAGKESIALDLAHPQARAVVLDLARVADVVVENFAPGVVARLGCDYATLAAVKPDLVYCSISGFGQTGPLARAARLRAHHQRGVRHDAPRAAAAIRRRARQYLQAADVLAGTHAFGAILAALWRRARTGEGAYLDVSMLECLVAADDVDLRQRAQRRRGVRRAAPGHDRARDRRALPRDPDGRRAALWPRLSQALGRPELAGTRASRTPAAPRATGRR